MEFLIYQEIDINRANPVYRYDQPLEVGDADAHLWCVGIREGGKAADLTGMSAKCYVTRAAGAAEKAQGVASVTVIQDAVVNPAQGTVSCLFDDGCYVGVGAAKCVMRLYDAAGGVMTAARMSAMLERNTSDAVYDPEGLVPSMDALLAQIATIEAATKAANEAAALANAAAKSANFQVLGQYDTLELLKAARPTGNAGDAWAIGEAEPYIVYIWDVDAQDYKPIGQLQGPTGPQGIQGAPGRGVQSVVLTSGDHSPGTMDTYTMYYTDGTSMQYMVYNGADGKDGSPGENGSDAQAIVYTINGESADSKGNFALSAADVGARASDWMPTAAQVGALPSSYTAPVTSVNSKTGAVTLSAADVGARPDTWVPTASQVGALPSTYTAPVSSVNGKTGAVTVPVLKLAYLQYDASWSDTQNALQIPVSAFSSPASTTDASKLCFMIQIYGKTCFVGDSFVSGSYLYIRVYNASWEAWGTGERVNIIYQTA